MIILLLCIITYTTRSEALYAHFEEESEVTLAWLLYIPFALVLFRDLVHALHEARHHRQPVLPNIEQFRPVECSVAIDQFCQVNWQ